VDPLIRTGLSSYVEVIMANASALFSSMVRAGKTTYFVDVKEAKNGKRYMAITENKIEEDEKKQRITVRVFSENVDQFRQAVDEAAAAVAS
jgi:3-hydroxymyristoyl/3-hydroxydecanoyl-(acyl carrier protein) dehydratase